MIGRGLAMKGMESSINDRSSSASVTSSMSDKSMFLNACSRYLTKCYKNMLEEGCCCVPHAAVDELGAAG